MRDEKFGYFSNNIGRENKNGTFAYGIICIKYFLYLYRVLKYSAK